jgi:hypothetical protein
MPVIMVAAATPIWNEIVKSAAEWLRAYRPRVKIEVEADGEKLTVEDGEPKRGEM